MKRYPLSYNPILEYYEQIKNGKVTVCDKIRKWYKHLSDKVINPTDGYHYEAKRGNHIIEFVENYCRHSKGKMGGQLVKLELWEKAWLAATFGFVDDDGIRQYNLSVLIIGKRTASLCLPLQ